MILSNDQPLWKLFQSLSLEQIGLQEIRKILHESPCHTDCQGHILIQWATHTHIIIFYISDVFSGYTARI